MEAQNKFHLYGRDVCFPQALFEFYGLREEFGVAARQQREWFLKQFDGYLDNPDSFLEDDGEFLRRAMTAVGEWGVEALTKHGHYDSTASTLVNAVYRPIGVRWYSLCKEVENAFVGIDAQVDEEAFDRELRKKTRSRAHGYDYYNLGRRAGSHMAAGAINLTTGAAHSMANAIGNALTRSGAQQAKQDELKAERETADDIIKDALLDIFDEVCGILGLSAPGLTEAEDARVDNLLRMPQQEATDTALSMLPKVPQDIRIYRFLLKQYKDPDGTLHRIAGQFHVKIDGLCREILDGVYAGLPVDTLEQTRESIETYRRELADYGLETDANLDSLLAREQQLFDAACTFHGTRYDSIEECEAAQKKFAADKQNIDALAPEIDAEIDKLVLQYTPESRDAAKAVHDALERQYAGLARTPKMLLLKQFLFVYARCEKAVEEADKSKATPMMRNIVAALCAAMIVLNVLNPLVLVARWILAIACGGFLWWQMEGLTDQKAGAKARAVLDSGAMFRPLETLVYTGKENYSLEHEDKAPDPEIQKDHRTAALAGLAAAVLIGAVCPMIAGLL